MNFRHLLFRNHRFRNEGIAKIDFSSKSCLKKSGMYSWFFVGGFGSCFSDFLGLENKLENRTIFYEIQHPNNPIWWGQIRGFLGPLKT